MGWSGSTCKVAPDPAEVQPNKAGLEELACANNNNSRAQPTKGQQSFSTGAKTRAQSTVDWESELKHMLANDHRLEAVTRAAPRAGGMVRCYVKRVKSFFGGPSSFQLHLESGDVFLLAAWRRNKSKVSSFVLSQDMEDSKKDPDRCLAKLKANFVGTEYMLWGKSKDKTVKKGYAAEQLCINFKGTALSVNGGPRSLLCSLPVPEAPAWKPVNLDGSNSLLSSSLDQARRKELPPCLERQVVMLGNKLPEWHSGVKAFVLDFHGRVKVASMKNFQLVTWDHHRDQKGTDLILSFGKIKEDVYALDFAFPLCAQGAFAIALASMDSKLCFMM